MSEIIIRTENLEALQTIADFLKSFGFEVIFKDKPLTVAHPPVTASAVNGASGECTDWLSLAGIWKNNPITAEELRFKAWGGRI
ncbi:MAG: hypothetical protein ACKVUS_03795 [Saprospiraceae bacterium]